MKCIVTGGAGFIGSRLTRKLLEYGHQVAVLDMRRPVVDVEWIRADVREGEDIRLQGCDAVFHLAALSNARRCAEDPWLCHQINVLGTVNVLRAARRENVGRVIVASSAWVASAQTGIAVEERNPFDLESINTNYTASKMGQEMACYSSMGEAKGPAYTILRFGTSYGEGMWNGLAVRAFMSDAESKGVITIMGDGKQYREFVYVDDLCAGLVLTLKDIAANKVYNLVGDRPILVEELAREVAEHFPAKIEYVPQQRPEPNPKRILNKSAKRELGWEPGTTLTQGIARCVDWWRSLTPKEKGSAYWI